MNASMNDSHNLGMTVSVISLKIPFLIFYFLAWKLTHVLRGWAKLSLLKTVNKLHSDFCLFFILIIADVH